MKEELIKLLDKAYAPYSNFHVSCIIETKDGKFIPGAAKFLGQERWKSPPSMAAPAQDGEDGPYGDALAHYRKLLDDREKGVGLFAK